MKLTDVVSQIRTETKTEVKKAREAETVGSSKASATDTVALSTGSKEVQQMRQIIDDTPDVRADRVEALKSQVESGEYQVDSRDIADKMLSSLMVDEGILGK